PGVPGRVPDNTRGSVNIDANEAARYFDVTLNNPGTITLDMNPQIDALSIAGAQSQLVIGGPYTLEVLLGTTLSAGTLSRCCPAARWRPAPTRRPAACCSICWRPAAPAESRLSTLPPWAAPWASR